MMLFLGILSGCQYQDEIPASEIEASELPGGMREVAVSEGLFFSQLAEARLAAGADVEFTLPNGTESPWQVRARVVDFLSPDFVLETQDGPVPAPEVLALQGSLADGRGEVHLLVGQDLVHGYVKEGGLTYRVEPKVMVTGRASQSYVVYDASLQFGRQPAICGRDSEISATPDGTVGETFRQRDCWKMDVRSIGDYEYYAYRAAGDLTVATFGILATIYDASSLYDPISVDITPRSVIVFTSTSNPFYFPTANGFSTLVPLLEQTRDFYNSFFPNPDPEADANLLFTGKLSRLIGDAYLSAVCRNAGVESYAVINTGYPSTALRNITAHEIGHLFGALHPGDYSPFSQCQQPATAPRVMANPISISSAAAFSPCARAQMQWHIWFNHDCLGRGPCQ